MPEITIKGWTTRDVRFPTSLDKTGSDAMNAAGDYSAAYCILETDSEFSGHGMVRSPNTPPIPPWARYHSNASR
jgi:L-galactonate dehydratase